MELSRNEHRVLQTLAEIAEPVAIGTLAERLELDQSPVTAACTQLSQAGLVQLDETPFREFRLGAEGQPFTEAPLPERSILAALADAGGTLPFPTVGDKTGLGSSVVGQTLRWLTQRGWARKDKGDLVLTAAEGADAEQPDEVMIHALAKGRVATDRELVDEGIDLGAALAILEKRKGFLVVKERVERVASIADQGRALLREGVTSRETVTQLTPELLTDGKWRDVELQPYDVRHAAKRMLPGKEHPFQRTLDRVRRVFLEMGFTEIVSPWVESSFWDFDALFQPQDHPARDMQDTFYVARPESSRLPEDALVERIQAVHETGGDTGSTGWQYRWSRDRAHKPVLRTHTTAATIRALAKHSAGKPGKYFVIGPVFRRETVDFKHLPIFHQVDGIIVDPQASLATLKGTLTAFYQKMGFPAVRFAPSFFPYTEPSAEVFALFERRNEFVEMGGSGIFRPEVTIPLGIHDRVLAWGLGLERLAMMLHDLEAIGDIYFASMPWLREAPLCQS